MASVSRALSIPLPNGSRISVFSALPFVLIHLLSLGIFFVPFHWYLPVACIAMYEMRMFFVTAGYHRYFSHRSYKTSRIFQFVIAFMAMTSVQKGALWWAAHHRHHHRFSDQEEDLHSPTLFGFFWSHIGWIISDKYNATRLNYIGDFAKFPELRWLDKYYLVPPVTLGVAALADRQLALAHLGFSAQHRARLARHLHHQLALPPLRFAPLQNHRHQQK